MMFSNPAEARFKTGLQGSNAMRTKTIVASEAIVSYKTLSHRGRSFSALPRQFAKVRRRVQTPAAILRSTQTRSVILAVKQVVVVSQFLALHNIAQRNDPHLALDLIGFTVRAAGMIHERRNAIPINDFLATIQTK